MPRRTLSVGNVHQHRVRVAVDVLAEQQRRQQGGTARTAVNVHRHLRQTPDRRTADSGVNAVRRLCLDVRVRRLLQLRRRRRQRAGTGLHSRHTGVHSGRHHGSRHPCRPVRGRPTTMIRGSVVSAGVRDGRDAE